MKPLWLLLPALAACGYRVDADMSRARVGGRLPAVEVVPFENTTFRRGLEVRLTRLVADELRARSPVAARNRESGDWVLEGTIKGADERVLSEDRDDLVRESSFVVTVEVTLRERGKDAILGKDSFTTRESYSSRAGRIATLQQAQEEALRGIAENIIYWLEARDPKENS